MFYPLSIYHKRTIMYLLFPLSFLLLSPSYPSSVNIRQQEAAPRAAATSTVASFVLWCVYTNTVTSTHIHFLLHSNSTKHTQTHPPTHQMVCAMYSLFSPLFLFLNSYLLCYFSSLFTYTLNSNNNKQHTHISIFFASSPLCRFSSLPRLFISLNIALLLKLFSKISLAALPESCDHTKESSSFSDR